MKYARLEPARWTPPKAPALEGPYARNERLARAPLWHTPGVGPEDVVVDARDRLVTGLVTGDILAFPSLRDGGSPTVLANTGGRPLGIERDDDGLVICDSRRGLLRLDAHGKLETLVDAYEGRRLRFTNNAAIARDGTIYFSDSSTKFGIEEYRDDILEHQPRGRLFAYDRKTRELRLLLSGLYFANGVALSRDESFLVVAETGAYRMQRVWLTGPRAGQSEVFIDNLPGFPDNVSSSGSGVFWVALAAPRNRLLDLLLPHPRTRRLVGSLPDRMRPQPERFGMVLGVDEQGRVAHNLQDPTGKVAFATGVREHDGRIFVGSLEEEHVAVLEL